RPIWRAYPPHFSGGVYTQYRILNHLVDEGIRYHSRAYINLIERDEAYEAVVTTQKVLESELNEAEAYVISLLPDPIDEGPVSTDWLFQSSTQLGGDAFGYHWLDDDRFAIYLLDVCGHGVGSALLSVSAINVIRNQTLPDVDFGDPGQVLAVMNNTFEMEENNNRFFTMWYGVYDRGRRSLVYSSGGHPPAILIGRNGRDAEYEKLATKGLMIGGMPDAPYTTGSLDGIDPGS
ncbi:MAG: PP2C family protein-serine/threonine phosphatase, partial [Limisphaerales bacterium]